MTITQTRGDRARPPAVAGEREDWQGPCVDDPEVWVSGNPPLAGHAAHVCLNHCPVLHICRRDLAEAPAELLRSVVQAGVIHNELGGRHSYRKPNQRCGDCGPTPYGVCPNCHGPLPEPTPGHGRPRRFCSDRCTQRWHDHTNRKTRLSTALCTRETNHGSVKPDPVSVGLPNINTGGAR